MEEESPSSSSTDQIGVLVEEVGLVMIKFWHGTYSLIPCLRRF